MSEQLPIITPDGGQWCECHHGQERQETKENDIQVASVPDHCCCCAGHS